MGEPATVTPIRPGAAQAFSRGDHVELAERVLDRLRRPPPPEDDDGPRESLVRPVEPLPVMFDVGEVWRYAPALGVWGQVPGHEVRNTVAGFAGAPLIAGNDGVVLIKASTAKGVEQVLRDRLLSEPGRVGFGAAPAGMAFSNGFLVVQGGKAELRPHSPMHLARWRYEFPYRPYTPGAAPGLERFLSELFLNVEDPTERAARVQLLQEFSGACLVGEAPRYQRYLVLFARGGNGKSELLRIFRAMFPPGTFTSIEPQKFRDDKFVVALESARANFVDELPDDEIMGGANVKRIITGEPITARTVFKEAVTFCCRAGHIYATNVEIQSTDHSDGFWERPCVLVLDRKFRQSSERRLEAAKGVVEQELPAVVAWAVEGALRAQVQQGYTEPASSRETLLEWRDDNDQVRGFFADKIADRPGKWEAAAMYEDYKGWAKENGCALMSSAKFGRRLAASGLATRGRDGKCRFYVVGEQVGAAG